MFEKEAEDKAFEKYPLSDRCDRIDLEKNLKYEEGFQDGSEFGYEKCKEELTERLENATEIIELMKDLFFACWQEKGINAIKFEQRVNDFLKGE